MWFWNKIHFGKYYNTFLKSSVFKFIFTKYLAFGIQLINSFLIAKYLGVFYFGLYGFFSLVLSYLLYGNFGVNYSINVIVSQDVKAIEKNSAYFSQAIIFTVFMYLIFFLVYILLKFAFSFNYFEEYLFDKYFYVTILIALLQNINNTYVSIYRIYNKLDAVNYFYLTLPTINLIMILFFNDITLFWSLIFANVFANIVNLYIFSNKSPITFNFKFNFYVCRIIIVRGFYLLLFVLSSVLLINIVKSVIVANYNIEEFALFTFSISFVASSIMLIESINFLFFPKMLNKFSKLNTSNEIQDLLTKIRELYLPIVIFTLFGTIMILPLVFKFLPKYYGAFTTIGFLSLYQLFNANNFGFTTLLLQKNKENYVTLIGFFTIGLFVLFSFIGIKYFKVDFSVIGLILAFVMMINNFLVFYFGSKIVLLKTDLYLIIKDSLNIKYILPFLLCVMLLQINKNYLFVLLFFIAFILLNYKILIKNVKFAVNLIKHNEKLELE